MALDFSELKNCKDLGEWADWLKKRMDEEEWKELQGKGEVEWQRQFRRMGIPERYHEGFRKALRMRDILEGISRSEESL